MVLEALGSALSQAVKKVMKAAIVDEAVVKELVRDLQRALLQADVNVRLVLDLSRRIEKRALEEEPPPGATRRELTLKIIYDELTSLLGGEKTPKVDYPRNKMTKIMLVGIQGSGKTTSAAKLAWFFKKRGYRVGLICADNYRPGAYDQLKQLAEMVGVNFFGIPGEVPVKVASKGVEEFKRRGVNLVIIDTAGRHKSEASLIEEMKTLAKTINPDEIMMVIDATLGQQAAAQASAFHEATPLGSIFLSKLDGSARGGGALSAVAATGALIKFVGTGEKVDEVELFSPPRFVSRLLGMGDLQSLVERLRELEKMDERAAIEAIASGKFTLRELYAQIQAMRKMGPLAKILQAIPGFGYQLPIEAADEAEEKLDKWLAIMQSMTAEELERPEIIDGSRAKRIARGSGTTPRDVRELIKQYQTMKKLVKQFAKKHRRMLGKGIFKGMGIGGG
ncbi:MAG: signal recognition particle protein [Candidatus Verstraetearchaeota archaeon]|nr:signal recognition particle protein [Candidatus Verstraetearchaeota archaeon]